MATVPASGTVFEMVATATMAVSTITGRSAFTGTAEMSAVGSMAVSSVLISPAPIVGTISISGKATMAVSKVIVTHPGAALIGAAISDVLGVFGCCGTPNDCALAEAVKAVNTGLQQFYLSDRVKGVATNVQRQIYYFGPPLDSDIDGSGAHLPDINVSAGAIAYGVTNSYSVQNVVNVVYRYPDQRSIVLRPVSVSPGSLLRPGVDAPAGTQSEGALFGWLEDSASADSVPLFYEVFQYTGQPIIRVMPESDQGGDETVTVHYIPKAAPVTADDLTNGRAFDVQAVYVESWIMPLCRYAALSSGYFDAANAPLAAAIREKYAETLQALGLADIQQPDT